MSHLICDVLIRTPRLHMSQTTHHQIEFYSNINCKTFVSHQKMHVSFSFVRQFVRLNYNQHLIFIFVRFKMVSYIRLSTFVFVILLCACTTIYIFSVKKYHRTYIPYLCDINDYIKRTLDKYKNYTKSSFYCNFGFSSVPLWKIQ